MKEAIWISIFFMSLNFVPMELVFTFLDVVSFEEAVDRTYWQASTVILMWWYLRGKVSE